ATGDGANECFSPAGVADDKAHGHGDECCDEQRRKSHGDVFQQAVGNPRDPAPLRGIAKPEPCFGYEVHAPTALFAFTRCVHGVSTLPMASIKASIASASYTVRLSKKQTTPANPRWNQ